MISLLPAVICEIARSRSHCRPSFADSWRLPSRPGTRQVVMLGQVNRGEIAAGAAHLQRPLGRKCALHLRAPGFLPAAATFRGQSVSPRGHKGARPTAGDWIKMRCDLAIDPPGSKWPLRIGVDEYQSLRCTSSGPGPTSTATMVTQKVRHV
jgi:hypothetical protein